ncbi:hypothetical protein IWQ60_005539 [Tieghemiomyces parasiticus]|uniref:Uncharacterized protein n=1 Tax=Tieghemiomyces parasiticus TaxID=78921 RepID=A0A9W8DSZ8_9FUNG|nr:hypothetical protein IWQ60_005539 [Tieghemiomyces parasiticus]
MSGKVSALVDKFSRTPEHKENEVTRKAREVITKQTSKASDIINRFNKLGVNEDGRPAASSEAKSRVVSENITSTFRKLPPVVNAERTPSPPVAAEPAPAEPVSKTVSARIPTPEPTVPITVASPIPETLPVEVADPTFAAAAVESDSASSAVATPTCETFEARGSDFVETSLETSPTSYYQILSSAAHDPESSEFDQHGPGANGSPFTKRSSHLGSPPSPAHLRANSISPDPKMPLESMENMELPIEVAQTFTTSPAGSVAAIPVNLDDIISDDEEHDAAALKVLEDMRKELLLLPKPE